VAVFAEPPLLIADLIEQEHEFTEARGIARSGVITHSCSIGV
jgi:hypothetical protein